ncbi:hypothetical protein SAMN04489733_0992 [Amycolatopsis keratiniphila]|nr:hypothetical protein SAMN04489733_0992 [Amycolatopsis keratiniphila]
MATVVVHLWVTPESGGLKRCSRARNDALPQVEAGVRVVAGTRGGWREGVIPKIGCEAFRPCPTLVSVMQQLLFL